MSMNHLVGTEYFMLGILAFLQICIHVPELPQLSDTTSATFFVTKTHQNY